ncbi:hypothetical protein [Telmatospirillum sp.]|uniref:hypothetical protein n=1 Tax=Telmatospirillum sp. TaxID=2079197 RepID=UPI00284412B7|nr:hypothetical protein [Telmatospirillum sp.]MDR3437456.1 hypothetical protein [Telmatospirillum sp.]
MAKYTISVTATIDSPSLIEGRCDAERLVELLNSEFMSVDYCVELRETKRGNTVFEETTGRPSLTLH